MMDWSKPEVIVAIVAAVTSAGALVTSIASIILNRRHNRAVLRPRLSFDFDIKPRHTDATVTLVNRGMGPANVTKFMFMIDGKAPKELGLTRFEQVTSFLVLPQGLANESR